MLRRFASQAVVGLCLCVAAGLPARGEEKVQAEQPPTTQPAPRSYTSDELVGKAAPDFDLRDAVPGAKRLSDLKGQVVVIVFHGEFCPPSRKAVQCLADVSQQSSAPFELIIANSWDTPEKAAAEMERLKISAPVVCDEKLAEQYKVEAIPLVVFVGADGKVTRTYVGYEGDSMSVKFSEGVAEALNKK